MEHLPETLRAGELATLLGVTRDRLSSLATAGHVVKTGRGQYRLAESVQKYAAYLRSPAARAGRKSDATSDPLKAARIRQAKASAEKIELQNRAARGELLDRAEVEREWTDILRQVRGEILALPSRIAGRLGHLSAHDLAEIDAELRRALTEAVENG